MSMAKRCEDADRDAVLGLRLAPDAGVVRGAVRAEGTKGCRSISFEVCFQQQPGIRDVVRRDGCLALRTWNKKMMVSRRSEVFLRCEDALQSEILPIITPWRLLLEDITAA